MNNGDLILLGKITKPYGNNGELLIKVENSEVSEINLKEPVYIEINNKQVPFFIKNYIFKGKNLILEFDDIVLESRTQLLLNKKIYLKIKPKKSKKKQFTFDDFIGYDIFDDKNNNKGKIINVEYYSTNIVFEVKYLKSKILVPVNEDLIIDIDQDNKKIVFDIPEGLYEIYL